MSYAACGVTQAPPVAGLTPGIASGTPSAVSWAPCQVQITPWLATALCDAGGGVHCSTPVTTAVARVGEPEVQLAATHRASGRETSMPSWLAPSVGTSTVTSGWASAAQVALTTVVASPGVQLAPWTRPAPWSSAAGTTIDSSTSAPEGPGTSVQTTASLRVSCWVVGSTVKGSPRNTAPPSMATSVIPVPAQGELAAAAVPPRPPPPSAPAAPA